MLVGLKPILPGRVGVGDCDGEMAGVGRSPDSRGECGWEGYVGGGGSGGVVMAGVGGSPTQTPNITLRYRWWRRLPERETWNVPPAFSAAPVNMSSSWKLAYWSLRLPQCPCKT